MPDNNGFILDTPLPLTARRVFGSPEMNQAVNQNAEDSASESVWTMQRFAEVSGKSWFALQERTLDGSIHRQYTGFGSELAELAAQMNITPRALPAISEEQFYANLSNNVRDYELGRQFAADPSAGIPHHLAPMDLSQFSNGLTDREFEQKIRAENQTGNQSAERESLVAVVRTVRARHGIRDSRQSSHLGGRSSAANLPRCQPNTRPGSRPSGRDRFQLTNATLPAVSNSKAKKPALSRSA